MVQAFLLPLKDTQKCNFFFSSSSHATLNETQWFKMYVFFLEQPKQDQTSEIYTPKQDDKLPHLLHVGVPPPSPTSLI